MYVIIFSVVEHQEDVKFELQGDRIPNFLKGSMKGDFFLTATKVIHFVLEPGGIWSYRKMLELL